MGALFSACLPTYNVNGQRYALKGRLGEGGFSIVELVESASGKWLVTALLLTSLLAGDSEFTAGTKY